MPFGLDNVAECFQKQEIVDIRNSYKYLRIPPVDVSQDKDP